MAATVLRGQCSFSSRLSCTILSKLSVGRTWSEIRWKLKPGKVLWPSVDIEGEFESHVRRQSHEVVLVVRCEDTAHHAVGAQSQALDLITAFDNVGLWKKARHLEQILQIEHNDSPSIDIQVEGDLQDEAILSANLLVQVAGRDTDSMGSVRHVQINVEAEWDT